MWPPMLRLGYPLVLLAALAAGRAHAQDGDRYGPRPTPYADGRGAPTAGALRRGLAPQAAAPLLRSLSWPGKTELRTTLGPAVAAGPPPGAPSPVSYVLRSAPAPTGRFPGMSAYGVASPRAAPALRPAAAPYADVASPSTPRPAFDRPARRAVVGSARPPALARQVVRLDPAGEFAIPAGRGSAQGGGSNLSVGLAAPAAYVPPGPAYGPALAAQAQAQAQAAVAATADTLPPPTVGRYGYVGPGRASGYAPPPPRAVEPVPARSAAGPVAGPLASPVANGGLGPPRPPAYARGYVLPPRPSPPVAPGARGAPAPAPAPGAPGATAARTVDGVRRYSVHREYGMEPDPLPVPPQFFAATADLTTPETEPAAPRNSKAAVNAARLAASGG